MSTEPMSDHEIRDALARCEKATPGPWTVSGIRRRMGGESILAVGPDGGWIAAVLYGKGNTPGPQGEKDHIAAHADAAFIAHARADFPRALATIQSQAARIAALTEALAEAGFYIIGRRAS